MIRFLACSLAFCLIPLLLSAQPSTEGKVWLVAVGISSYYSSASMSRLDFTVQGANNFVRLFEQRQLVTVEEPLVNQKASRSNILTAMRKTFIDNPEIKPEDMIIFYFSGHGEIAGGKEGICPYEYNPNDVRGLIRNEEIQQIMSKSNARHKVCFIEACKTEVQRQAIVDPSILKSFNQERRKIGGGLVFFTSTEAGMPSLGNPASIGGYFTYFLIEGLKGKANSNDDAYITVKELFSYLEREVSNYTDGLQVPQINDLGSYNPDLPLIIIPEKLPSLTKESREYYPPGFEYLTNQMVQVHGGRFQMGSEDGDSDEKPIHAVTVNDFQMSKYEVTVEEFSQFIEDSNYQTDAEKDGGSYLWDGTKWDKKAGVYWKHDTEGVIRPRSDWNHPVIHVSWNDATEYCRWLSRKTGQSFRLPTEAEWEYAAGNGSKHSKYSWGNQAPSGKKGGNVADEAAKRKFNWAQIFEGYDDGYATTAPVGQYYPNEFGLYDMTGNVWEWCQDVWHDDYNEAPTDGSGWASGGDSTRRVVRGGSWCTDPNLCRVAIRDRLEASDRGNDLGFRLARY